MVLKFKAEAKGGEGAPGTIIPSAREAVLKITNPPKLKNCEGYYRIPLRQCSEQ